MAGLLAVIQVSDSPASASTLLATCLHEYAHLAAARHFGATGFVRISRVDAARPSWFGRFQLFGELAADEWRVVALAGVVAELLAREGSLDAAHTAACLAHDPALLTGADGQLARGYGIEDVARCLAIVKRAWREIASDAIERANEVAVGPGCAADRQRGLSSAIGRPA